MRRLITAIFILTCLTLLRRHGGKTGKELDEEAGKQRSDRKTQDKK